MHFTEIIDIIMQNCTHTKLSCCKLFFDYDQNFENFNDCDIPCVPSISLWDIYNHVTCWQSWFFLEWLYLFKSEVSRYLWTPQGQKLGCPDTVDTNGLTPMEECTQSWAWVHFAKSNPTQSTSWLTQSNSIHNDHVYSDPHPIQSIVPRSGKTL